MSPLFLAISYFFHLVATVVWLGGLALLVLMVWPETRRALSQHPAVYTFLSRLRRRFFPIANFSLLVLVVTGMFQMPASPHYEGMLAFDNEWSRAILFKHIAVVGMVICGLALQYLVAPALERASLLVERGKGDPDEFARLRRREVRLTWANVGLGALVLAFTAWATAL